MNRQSFATVCLLFALCMMSSGCSQPIPLDKNGDSPESVVLKAYSAAIDGDFDEANSYATPDFEKYEKRSRDSIAEGRLDASIPSAAWQSRVFQAENAEQLAIESVHWNGSDQRFVNVMIVSPKGKAEVSLVLVKGEWKLAGAKDVSPK